MLVTGARHSGGVRVDVRVCVAVGQAVAVCDRVGLPVRVPVRVGGADRLMVAVDEYDVEPVAL